MTDEKKITMTADSGESVDFYVLEETRIGGTDYLLVTDEMDEEDGECYILKDLSGAEDDQAVYEFVENDEELDCDVIAIFEADSRQYIALLPVTADEDSDDGQIFLYRLIDNGEDEEPGLENIADDDEFERASEAFNDWMDAQDFGDIDLDDIEP